MNGLPYPSTTIADISLQALQGLSQGSTVLCVPGLFLLFPALDGIVEQIRQTHAHWDQGIQGPLSLSGVEVQGNQTADAYEQPHKTAEKVARPLA